MKYTKLSAADYDGTLREIGNYLWQLEQSADTASARQETSRVAELEEQIRRLTLKAERFAQEPGDHQALAFYVSGLGNRMLRDWARAATFFDRIVQTNPRNGDAWLELTWCRAELGEWPASAEAARRATEIFPKAAASWSNLALALAQIGRPEEARVAEQRALELGEWRVTSDE